VVTCVAGGEVVLGWGVADRVTVGALLVSVVLMPAVVDASGSAGSGGAELVVSDVAALASWGADIAVGGRVVVTTEGACESRAAIRPTGAESDPSAFGSGAAVTTAGSLAGSGG